ncbi:MAG: DUF1576 domain-containing protein, partial [Candidatus Izemoplasmataceae bacterium]
GYVAILKSPSVLISDYLHIGGFGATMFNVSTIMLINIVMLNRLKMKMTGPMFAGLLTIAGFSFFGKNVFNTIPIYIGIYLFARRQGLEFKSFMIVVLFSTGISPIVSFMIFGTGWPLFIGIPAGMAVGVLTGYVLPPLTAHTVRFHKGYNLYNIGFAMGILSMVYSAILRAFEFDFFLGGPTSEAYHDELFFLTVLMSLIFIGSAFLEDRHVLRRYPALLKDTGRLVSDFIRDHGRATTMLNVGFMGLLSLAVLTVLRIEINGPVMGGILTVMGFGAFGKHPRNAVPVMTGALIGALASPHYSLDEVGMAIAILFVTALSPIAGRYGFFIGVVAGFIHIIITPIAYEFQGGFDLYNNGFAAGFVAATLIPIIQAISKNGDKEATA